MAEKKKIDEAVAKVLAEKKAERLATLKRISVIIGIVIAVGGALWGSAQAAIYYHLDERYVQVASYVDAKKQERVAFLNEKIFILTFKVNSGKASPMEHALLERYKNELQNILGH